MVTTAYFDTSAAMKLAVRELETMSLRDELAHGEERTLVSSWLLHTELHCAAGRRVPGLSEDVIADILRPVALVDLTRADLLAAGTYAPLRSQDAIHLAVALRVGADEMVTYDAELADAARRAGLRIVAPTG